ncbi:MAG: hypothetical protein KC516_04115 [Nanoarchaeota archaeon]|nr:hypothetical protein [Nanoarchaeota archaeon]
MPIEEIHADDPRLIEHKRSYRAPLNYYFIYGGNSKKIAGAIKIESGIKNLIEELNSIGKVNETLKYKRISEEQYKEFNKIPLQKRKGLTLENIQ